MVHPNAAGARVIADAIWPQLATLAQSALSD
jgi:lysophospholipase L1-like esterase